MLHVIYGKDREKGRKRFRALREKLGKECGEERTVSEGEVSGESLNSFASSQGLFGGTTLFMFDCIFDKKVEQEILLKHAKDLHLSQNLFLVFEPELDKKIAGEIKNTKAEVEEFAEKKNDTRADFNIFSLSDALGRRNRKELWVLYQGAREAGIEPEEICGTLFWAVKNIALVKNAEPNDDCGLSPYVAPKARVFAKNYSEVEIMNLSRVLTAVYHEAHRGGEPMEIALERFTLSL